MSQSTQLIGIAYTYNNYARDGFAHTCLRFGNLVSLESKGPACAQRVRWNKPSPYK